MKATHYYEYERVEVLDLVPREATRVLDVGCGTGWLGDQLKRRQGAVVWGIEPVLHAAEAAAKRLDRVWPLAVETALGEIPDGACDCIVTADVLEHLVDPWAVLARLRGKLAPGGVLVASIPNVRNWEVVSGLIQGSWRYVSEGLLDRTHLRFFTRRSVEALFWSAGLTITDLRVTPSDRPVPVPPVLIRAFQAAGLRADGLKGDGQVKQYLVVARQPSAPVRPATVGVVVLHLGRSADTLECLTSARRLDYPAVEIVVVPAVSDDDPMVSLCGAFPDVTVLRTGERLGIPAARNAGIRHAMARGAEYVLMLDANTVADPPLLTHLMGAVSVVPAAGLWGPKICHYSQPDLVWATGFEWDPVTLGFVRLDDREREDSVTAVQEVEALMGCAMLLGKDVIERVGGFDPDYYLSWDDVDFCARAVRLGFKCVAVPAAKIRYKAPRSPAHEYFDARNRLLWIKRHLSSRALRGVRRRAVRDLRQQVLRDWFEGMSPRVATLREAYWWMRVEWRDPVVRARLRALIDYTLGRVGDCPKAVKRLGSQSHRA